MRREARQLYEGSEIIQESTDRYFDRCDMEIQFGIVGIILIIRESSVSVRLNTSNWKAKKVEITCHQSSEANEKW